PQRQGGTVKAFSVEVSAPGAGPVLIVVGVTRLLASGANPLEPHASNHSGSGLRRTQDMRLSASFRRLRRNGTTPSRTSKYGYVGQGSPAKRHATDLTPPWLVYSDSRTRPDFHGGWSRGGNSKRHSITSTDHARLWQVADCDLISHRAIELAG